MLSNVLIKSWNSFINFSPHCLHACRGSKPEDECVWTQQDMRKRKHKIEKNSLVLVTSFLLHSFINRNTFLGLSKISFEKYNELHYLLLVLLLVHYNGLSYEHTKQSSPSLFKLSTADPSYGNTQTLPLMSQYEVKQGTAWKKVHCFYTFSFIPFPIHVSIFL